MVRILFCCFSIVNGFIFGPLVVQALIVQTAGSATKNSGGVFTRLGLRSLVEDLVSTPLLFDLEGRHLDLELLSEPGSFDRVSFSEALGP